MDDVFPDVTHDDPSFGPFDTERLLGGERLDRPDLDDLQAVLDALRAPASSAELSSESAAVAAFVTASSAQPARRKPMLVRLVAGKAAAVAAVACVSLSGAAAYAGVLPPSLQTVAHNVIKAPAPHDEQSVVEVAAKGDDSKQTEQPETSKTPEVEKSDETETPEPSETPKAFTWGDPQTFGLCTAYLAHHKHDASTVTGSAPADDPVASALAGASGLEGEALSAACTDVIATKHGGTTESPEASSPGKSGQHSTHGQDEKARHSHKGGDSQDSTEAESGDDNLPSQASTHATSSDDTNDATESGDDNGGSGRGDNGSGDNGGDSHGGGSGN